MWFSGIIPESVASFTFLVDVYGAVGEGSKITGKEISKIRGNELCIHIRRQKPVCMYQRGQ